MSNDRVELSYIDYEWGLEVRECPCDVQVIEWVDEHAITDAAIYHFGTGSHHYVGVESARPQRRNSVLGITASPAEHSAFVRLSIERPEVLRYYNAVFGDIYLLNPRLLPRFDVVTLFHLCEFRSWQHDAYGALTDLQVLEALTDQTVPGGHILFYTGSMAWDWDHINTQDVIAEWEQTRDVERVGEFKTLLVYRRRT